MMMVMMMDGGSDDDDHKTFMTKIKVLNILPLWQLAPEIRTCGKTTGQLEP